MKVPELMEIDTTIQWVLGIPFAAVAIVWLVDWLARHATNAGRRLPAADTGDESGVTDNVTDNVKKAA
jgi:hypothetical protein